MGLFRKDTPEEKAMKAEAKAEERKAYREGLIKGSKARGRREGYAKGSKGGGALSMLAGGLKAFEAGASQFSSGIDLGKMGTGLGSGSAFGVNLGGGGGRSRSTGTKKRRRSTSYRPRYGERVVYVEGPAYQPRRRRSRR